MSKINVVFFSSGDFGIPTLKELIKVEKYNVKGVVTSKDKVIYNDKKVVDIAKENNIPFCIPKDEDELYDFLSSIHESILFYVVISYKKLSNRILSLVDGRAINVHASVLPFLRGAAPINWAIRLGFKQTGLTAFKLSDRIDSGDIIKYECIDINDNDTYDTLFKRLSNKCVYFTKDTINQYNLIFSVTNNPSFTPQINIGLKRDILVAPKITKKYWDGWLRLSMEEIDRLFKSTSNGLPCKIYVIDDDKNTQCDVLDAKIWDYEFISNFEDGSDSVNWYPTECDGKTYIRVAFGDQVEKVLLIKEIQLEGRKRMYIEDFLRGFKYTRNNKDNYRLVISSDISD